MKHFYKIVSKREDSSLVSVSAYGLALTVYKINEFVSAPLWLENLGYGLCVFESFFEAHAFCPRADMETTQLYTCEVKDILPLKPTLESGWLAGGFSMKTNNDWPIGTMMVKQVKLLEQL